MLKLWRGNIALKEKSIEELEEIFLDLDSKLEETNRQGANDKKYDYMMIAKNEVHQILESQEKRRKKKFLLLTQIGYLRINLFGKYYEQIQLAQNNNELEKAVSLMHTFAETLAIPFISTESKPSWSKKFKSLFSGKEPVDPIKQIGNWESSYDEWAKWKQSASSQTDRDARISQFEELKKEFITLYTISFSVDDFPPLRNRRSDK